MIGLPHLKWIKKQKTTQKIKVDEIKISNLIKWKYDKKKIFHTSNKFFKIIGVDIKKNLFKKNWDQPIIKQNEIGILGIIKDKIKNKYLLQAKLEPGNINKLQLSPTVQATKSNYSKVHGGKNIAFLDFFLKKQKYKILQSEQGFRYYKKFNANIIYTTGEKINYNKNFRWLSINEIKYLLNKKNLINMDTLSVFSSFIKKKNNDFSKNNFKSIMKWMNINDKKYFLNSKIKDLSNLKDWNISDYRISNLKNLFFSVIGINVNTNLREVKNWSQPIIKGKTLALTGFLIKDFNRTKHYLCRYILKPGSKKGSITCTANTSDLINYRKDDYLSLFQKKIIKNCFLNKKNFFLYNNILSDEGGRFYHTQVKYIAVKFNSNDNIEIPKTYMWISQNQMIDLIKKKKIDIEARLLFGIINIKDTI